MNIEENICLAIETIVNRAIEKANYDKTIQATIINCVDETIGKYKVRYKDSTFFAYSNNLDITYSENSLVYILVPNNDFSSNKTILGTTEKLGINYIPTIEDIDYYDIIGKNCVEDNSNIFGICSYRKDKYVKVLYSKDFTRDENLIQLNKEDLAQYLTQSDNLICGATVKTQLPSEQQFKGNYGIIFALDFLDNSTQEKVTRYYTVDVNNIRGNPYKILTDTRQYGIFPIDGKNFVEVNYISIFCYGFPNTKEDEFCVDDIFIKNLEIQGSVRIEDREVDGVLLTLVTKKGLYFDKTFSDEDELSIEALVKVKGRIADNETQDISFYWFIEHAGITLNSTYYNSYGGQGWKCLNEYNIIQSTEEGTDDIVEWIPSKSLFNIKKKDAIAKENKYKCVAIYDGTIVEKEIIIKNLDSEYEITIVSDSGTQFYFDNGNPTLTCLVNGVEEASDEYIYSWGVTNNNNIFSSLVENINEEYSDVIVEKNVLKNINVNTITNFNVYQCTVYRDGVYLGTASLKIFNSLSNDDLSYSIVINNGSEVYKYNENGISPASSTLESPIQIKQLSFIVYDRSGNAIKDDIIKNAADIRWEIPLKNTLLNISDFKHEDYEEDEEKGIAIYKNALTLSYDIDDIYDISATNNTIRLFVTYNGIVLSTETNFTFLKEGEPGTNGTEFVCKIVPNIVTGDIPEYPIITQNGLTNGSQWDINYAPNPATTFFKVQLWRNGINIFSGTRSGTSQEGKEVKVSWDILRNRYSGSIFDKSSFTVNSETGVFGNYKGYDLGNEENNGWKAAIVKVTVNYDKLTYYATLPIIERKIINKNVYDISLKNRAGFKYAIYTSDGVKPKYDNTNPFEIITKEFINGEWIDITLEDNITYEWNIKGSVFSETKYENSQFVEHWIDSLHLEDYTTREDNPNLDVKADPKNVCIIRPAEKYDGYCITNAIECVIKKDNSEIGRINIPIHLLLNRYSNSELNDWDGNSISIDEDGGFILSPQVGAGHKESDNSFTGVVLGSVKENSKAEIETGLFGFSKGSRSIFLDAETGKAEFGTSTSGRIVIDPTTREALIYSSNYSDTGDNKGGLRINLTEPEIRFGTGNFYVDKDGHLFSKGGGSIAGWEITDGQLYSENKSIILDSEKQSIHSDGKIRTDDNIGRIGFFLDKDDLILGSRFRANSEGILELGEGAAKRDNNPRWTITGRNLSSDVRSFIVHGYNIFNNDFPPLIRNGGFRSGSVYIGTDGIAVGSNIRLDSSSGKLYATGAELNNVEITGGSTIDGYATSSQLEITDKKFSSVYSSTSQSFDTSSLGSSSIVYGYGSPPDVSIYPPSSNTYKYYVDKNTGNYYYCNGSYWSSKGVLPLLVTTKTSSVINDLNGFKTEYKTDKKNVDESITTITTSLENTKDKVGFIIREDNSLNPNFTNNIKGEVSLSLKGDQTFLTAVADNVQVNAHEIRVTVGGTLAWNSTYSSMTENGILKCQSADITGKITVTSGSIGNIDLTGSMLKAWNSNKTRFAGFKASDDGYAITVGATNSNNWGSGVFKVQQDGKLEATGVDISGKIVATSGQIGGFNIGTYTLTGHGGGKITGLQIPSNGAYSIAVGVSENSGSWASAPFRVTHGGKMTSTDADIKGRIIANKVILSELTIKSSKYYRGLNYSFNIGTTTYQFIEGVLVDAHSSSSGGSAGNPNAPFEF